MAVNAGHYRPFLYQGGFFLVAIAAAVLITAAVADGTSRLRTALSWKPLVWIGLISYGLYLFHVPLFGFVNAQHVVTAEPARVAMRFAFAFVVAAVSYVLVEQPIRRGALTRTRLLVVAPVTIACVLALVLVTTAGATGPTRNELEAAVFAKARTDTAAGTTRVLVAGDTLASSFVSAEHSDFSGSGIHGVVEWATGCDVLDAPVAFGGHAAPTPPCDFESSYPAAVFNYQPDVAVLTLGPRLMFDRMVDGTTVEVGTPEYRDWLYGRLDALRKVLVREDATFLLTTVPCVNPSTTGQYGGLAAVERDPRRIAAANEVLRAYARDRHVRLADLGGFLCEHPGYLNGIELTPSGATAAWQWLAPIAREAQSDTDRAG
jgi:hypothetical protein